MPEFINWKKYYTFDELNQRVEKKIKESAVELEKSLKEHNKGRVYISNLNSNELDEYKYSRIPIYEQIVNNIEKYVAVGILREKSQIPSIRELANNLGINPNTVKKSYDILENRGVITTISTKGTFISENTKKATDEKINKEISIIREKIDELTKMGISYDEIIERIKKWKY